MTGRICPTLREAIHSTATTFREGMKKLAGELDWSPSELSMRTTLGGDSARPFPSDDEHLIKIQRVTGDVSILFTMADLLGFEPPQHKRERLPEMVAKLTEAAEGLQRDIRQLVIDFKDYGTDKRRAR